jgi:hypothetical protein
MGRPRTNPKPIPDHAVCQVCRTRWAQNKRGVCRTCAADAGLALKVIEIERDRLERQQARMRPVYKVGRVKWPGFRSVIVNGVEFDVAWDGTLDGAEAFGIPRAEDRPGGYDQGRLTMGDAKRNSTVQTVSSKYADRP